VIGQRGKAKTRHLLNLCTLQQYHTFAISRTDEQGAERDEIL
jgi:hypothetical protein